MTKSPVPAGVLVRFFAAAQAAAGVEQQHVDWATLCPNGASVTTLGVLQRVLSETFPKSASDHTPDVGTVFKQCSFLLDGRATTDPAQTLHPGITVDVLPPFAGG